MEGQETRKTRSASATQLLHAEGTSYSSKTRAHKEDEMDDGLQTSPPLENMQDVSPYYCLKCMYRMHRCLATCSDWTCPSFDCLVD